MRKREITLKPNKIAFTKEHRMKISIAQLGEKNNKWKGDSVGYKQVHKWVRARKPIPALCPKCGESKKLQLSNIGRKYTRDFKNWEYLCVKCHVYKDGTVYNLKGFHKSKRSLKSRSIDPIDPLNLESRIVELEKFRKKVEGFLILP